MKVFTMISICAILFGNSIAKTIHVPADQTTIQAGINAAIEGDTVLVQPGTYVENINFIGKNIVVASLFLTTQDTSYISQTVIDGDSSGCVVRFMNGEDSTATLTGFLIQNGSGYDPTEGFGNEGSFGGGIYCLSSSPRLIFLIIQDNQAGSHPWTAGFGGGIYCGKNANPEIRNVRIFDNLIVHGLGAGILCEDSNPRLFNVTISKNFADCASGAGIGCLNSFPVLNNVFIFKNSTTTNEYGDECVSVGSTQSRGNIGGGIWCENSNPDLLNVNIYENNAKKGGGVYLMNSNPFFSNVSIVDNFSFDGGGIYIKESQPVFDDQKRNNIYNNHATFGNDLYASESDIIHVSIDTFSVKNPTDYHAFLIEKFDFDILHGKTEQIKSDIYVNPNGDNTNNGLSPEKPLKTIRHALLKAWADSQNPLTIHCANGRYSPSTNGEMYPLLILDNISLLGENEHKVILDAEIPEFVLNFYHNNNSTIKKMTIKSVYGSYGWDMERGGTGILCDYYSNPQFVDLTVSENAAGILCDNFSSPSLTNVTLCENGLYGISCSNNSNPILTKVKIFKNAGGISCDNSNPVLKDVLISDNEGSGLFCTGSTIELSNVTIRQNRADTGGGIYCENSNLIFDSNNRCNIYLNQAISNLGIDIYAHESQIISVLLDTFTVIQPKDVLVYPVNNFSFSIMNSKIEQVSADLFVSPDGRDDNSGLSPEQPLLTIYCAAIKMLASENNRHTIFLKNAIYSPSKSRDLFPLRLPDYVTLSGESRAGVILDAESRGSVLVFDEQVDISLENLTITGGHSDGYGGGILCFQSKIKMNNLKIKDNYAWHGGGAVYCDSSTLDISNVLIRNNKAGRYGGGLYIKDSILRLTNTTICDNESYHGGGIFFNNSLAQFDSKNRCSIYSNFSEKLTGHDLRASSNCKLMTVFVDTFTVLVPTDKYANPKSKFSFDILHAISTEINLFENTSPTTFALYPNYPNPFNPATTLQYDLPRTAHVQLVVYDVLGRQVKRLMDEQKAAGQHKITWDATNDYGERVAAGLYFCRLQTEEFVQTLKMVLVR